METVAELAMSSICRSFMAGVGVALLSGLCAQPVERPGGVYGNRTSVMLEFDGARFVQRVVNVGSDGAVTTDTSSFTATEPLDGLNFHPLMTCSEDADPILLQPGVLERLTLAGVTGGAQSSAENVLVSITHEDTTEFCFTSSRAWRRCDNAYINALGVATSPGLFLYAQRTEEDQRTAYLECGSSGSTPLLPVEQRKRAIPEVHVFPRVLSPAERGRLESCLAMKYGISRKESYLNSAGDTIWNCRTNKVHSNRIVALAKDSISGLAQRQSTSAAEPGFLVVAADTVAHWNFLNEALLTEGDFILFGDDDGRKKWAEREPGCAQLLEREWMAQRTGIAELSGVVHLDSAMVLNRPDFAQTHWLVIDRTGAGDYPLGGTDYVRADVVPNDSVLRFHSITWDTDASGTDVFTFASGGNFIPTTWVTQPSCDPMQDGAIHVGVQGGDPMFSFRITNSETAWERAWTSGDGAVANVDDIEPGEYRLRISDASGFSIDDVLWIQAVDAPVIALQDHYELTAYSALTLEPAVEGGRVLYEWKRDGTVISTDERLRVDRTGDYQCNVVADGCKARKVFNVSSTAQTGALDLSAMPNPAHGDFAIQVALNGVDDVVLHIADGTGQRLATRTLSGGSFYRVEEHLDGPGIYLVTAVVHGEQRTVKVVVL